MNSRHIPGSRRIIPVFLAFLLLFITLPPVAAVETGYSMTAQEQAADFGNYQSAPIYAPPEIATFPLSLSNEFPKTSYADWNQGSCGNCWVWGATASVAQSYYKFSNLSVPLSIQYFNSNYYDGNINMTKPHKWACTGDTTGTFVAVYNANLNQSYAGGPFVVPWGNYNASYKDGDAEDDRNTTTLLAKNLMNISPNIGFSRMTAERVIAPDPTNQTEAIRNITAALAAGNVLDYSIDWGDTANSSLFTTFYNTQPDSAIFDPTVWKGSEYNKTQGGGGHYMVLVGYNKTDADTANHYWIVQNSWGTSANRTKGQFRLKMYVDYTASFTDGDPVQQFWVINVSWKTDPKVTGITPSSGTNTGPVTITDLAGTGFNSTQSTVRLAKAGQADIVATGVSVDSDSKIRGTFDLSSAETGTWDVIVTGGDGRSVVFRDGFSVDAAPPASVPFSDMADYENPAAGVKEDTLTGPSPEASVDLQTNTLGQTLAPYSVETPEDSPVDVAVSIPQATRSLTAAGTPVDEIGLTPLTSEQLATITAGGVTGGGAMFSAGGPAVECTPSGATFDHPVSITFTMTRAQWDAALEKAGGKAQDITVQYFNPTTRTWTAIPTTVDTMTRKVTGSTTHFTLFAVLIRNEAAAVPSPVPTTRLSGIPPQSPATPQITAAPTTAAPPKVQEPSSGFPVMAVLAGAAGLAILIGVILIVRRWWIRRQNPGLFRKYE